MLRPLVESHADKGLVLGDDCGIFVKTITSCPTSVAAMFADHLEAARQTTRRVHNKQHGALCVVLIVCSLEVSTFKSSKTARVSKVQYNITSVCRPYISHFLLLVAIILLV